MANTCANSSGRFKAKINLSGSGTEHPSSRFCRGTARLLDFQPQKNKLTNPASRCLGADTRLFSWLPTLNLGH